MFKCLFHVYDDIFDLLFCSSVCFFFTRFVYQKLTEFMSTAMYLLHSMYFFPIAFFILKKIFFHIQKPHWQFFACWTNLFHGCFHPKFRHWTNGHALKVSKTPQPNLRSLFPIHTFHTNLCRLIYLLLHPILSNNYQKPSPYDIQKWGLAKELQVWSSSPIYFGTLKVFQEILG